MVGRKNELPESLDKIPIGQPYPGVSCIRCLGPASCCHDVVIELTDDEAADLRDAGTILEEQPRHTDGVPSWLQKFNIFDKIHKIRRELGEVAVAYRMEGSCGHLVNDGGLQLCGVWGTERQPEACKKFSPGCVACVRMQWRDLYDQQASDSQR